MPQQQEQFGWRESTNIAYAFSNAYSTAVTVFLRHSFGREALGWHGFFAFILILVIAGFGGSPAMVVYLGAWVFALVCQRIYTFSLVRKGVVLHSKFRGWPVFAKLTFGNPQAAALVIEPLIAAGAGYVLLDLGEPVLGWFLIWGAGAMLFREVTQVTINRRRVQAMEDARIEQEWLARQYRNQ